MKLISILVSQFLMMINRNFLMMVVGTTTDASLIAETDAFYDKLLIQPLRSAWIFGKYGQKRQVKDNKTVRFSTYPSLGTQVTALSEGINPSPQKMTKTSITATASLYGGYVEITEECDIYRVDPIVALAQERVSWQAAESLDEITRDIIYAGTNVAWAGTANASTAVTTIIAAADLRKLARSMMNKKTPFFKKMIGSSTGVGSSPINNAWLMFISPEVLYDLDNSVTGWTPVVKYSTQSDIEEQEVGSFGYFRMLMSTECPVLGGATYTAVGSTGLAQTVATGYIDVHQCLAIAPDAYGVVDVDGGIKTIRKDKTQIGGPLELYGTAGWKARYTAKILDDDRMYRYECGVTA
jgi:N4-gp56 family major capsid protein